MNKLNALIASMILSGTTLMAAPINLVITPAVDYWKYDRAGDPLVREIGSAFIVPTGFTEDARYGNLVYKFAIIKPGGFPPTFRVTAATLTLWHEAGGDWPTNGTLNSWGTPSQNELYATGFGPTFSESTWNGTQPFSRFDPFPRDLITDADVTDLINGTTPWAVGAVTGYTPGSQTIPFPVTFTMNVNNTTIQNELIADINSGFATWFVSATFELVGQTTTGFPRFIMNEGVTNNPGSVAPTLRLTVEEVIPTAVQTWDVYQ